MNIISITDENGTIHEFEQPNFNCTLLTAVNKYIIGYTSDNNEQIIEEQRWVLANGNSCVSVDFDLTPVKQPWYRTCKFPCLIWVPSRCEFDVITNHLQIQGPNCRPATEAEALSLVHHD